MYKFILLILSIPLIAILFSTLPGTVSAQNPFDRIPTQFTTRIPERYLSPSPIRRPTATPIRRPTATPIRRATTTPTDTPNAGNLRLNFTLKLHGIGNGGDNVNQNGQGNRNPRRASRPLTVELLNRNHVPVATQSGTIAYNATSGLFTGTMLFTRQFPAGSYLVRVKSDHYLKRLARTIISIQANTQTPPQTIETLSLITGDIRPDNALNIFDYTQLLTCYSDFDVPAPACTPALKNAADLTDDGNVDLLDYNLFLREMTVQQGE